MDPLIVGGIVLASLAAFLHLLKTIAVNPQIVDKEEVRDWSKCLFDFGIITLGMVAAILGAINVGYIKKSGMEGPSIAVVTLSCILAGLQGVLCFVKNPQVTMDEVWRDWLEFGLRIFMWILGVVIFIVEGCRRQWTLL